MAKKKTEPKNQVWKIRYEILPSNSGGEWCGMEETAAVLGQADSTPSVEAIRVKAMKETWPELDPDGNETKKKVHVVDFRLLGIERLITIDFV